MFAYPIRFSLSTIFKKTTCSALVGIVIALLLAATSGPAHADIRDTLTFPDYKKVETVRLPRQMCSAEQKQRVVYQAQEAANNAKWNTQELVKFERQVDALPRSAEKSQLSNEVSRDSRRMWRT